jgi:hypothetical protein
MIGEEVWKQGNKDVGDVISLGKLLRKGDGPDDIEGLVKTLVKVYHLNAALSATRLALCPVVLSCKR